jgi:hypothetical protein
MTDLKLTGYVATENDIKSTVRDYLDHRGIFHFHLLGCMGSYKGAPDRIALYKTPTGRVYTLCLEMKRVGYSQSPDQLVFEERANLAGAVYLVVRKLEDLIDCLKELDKNG